MATAKNTICLWYDHDAEEAARFYAQPSPIARLVRWHKAATLPSARSKR